MTTITLHATDVYAFPIIMLDPSTGNSVPPPAGDVFTATVTGPGAAAISASVGPDATSGRLSLIIHAVTLPSPNTLSGISVEVTDSAGDTAAPPVLVDYPVPAVDEITFAGPNVTTQPAPTAPGP